MPIHRTAARDETWPCSIAALRRGRPSRVALVSAALLVVLAFSTLAPAQSETSPAAQSRTAAPAAEATENRWEPSIRRFEELDRKSPPAPGGIVFVGSSSIVGWKLDKFFPDLPVVNRGFGGSQLADSVHFADRIVVPYKPRVVVLYAGDNDIASGKSPEQVAADFDAFVAKIRKALPHAKIIFIPIKPSLARWKLIDKMRQANALIRRRATECEGVVVLDIEQPMLGEDGRPRAELFREDGLHLNDAGYRLWSDLLRPHLEPETTP